MQIIINILAGIGALTVLSIAWVIVIIAMEVSREKKKEDTKKKQPVCALTDENCIFVAKRGHCTGCPIAEEAEKHGRR